MPIYDKKLVFIKENYKISLWPLCMTAEMLKYNLYKLTGSNDHGEILGEWKNRVNRWAIEPNSEGEKITKNIFKKVSQNQKWLLKNIKLIYFYSDELVKFTQKIFNYDLKLKSDRELLELYLGYREEFLNMYTYAWLPNILEGRSNFFSSKLENILRLKLEKINGADKLGRFMNILSAPTKLTNREKEELEFLRIVSVIMEDKNIKNLFASAKLSFISRELQVRYPDAYKIIYSHYQKYCWIPFDYDGPAWDLEYFLEKMKKVIKSKTEISQEIKKIKDEKIRIRKLQKKYESELDFSKDRKISYFFAIARELLFLKDYRKDALFKSYYHMDKLINEIGIRLSLSPIQVKHILPQEMEDALVKRRYSEGDLNRRINHSVLLYKNTKKGQHPRKPIQIFTDKEAEEIIKKKVKIKNIDSDIKKMSGQTAYSGIVRGRIKLIFSVDDLNKMKERDILVSPATNPNLLPAMKKSSAIITDEGGITCHAAIVSRELKKPCIIGTKIATQVLHDGDLVEVDADKGVVRIIKKAKKN